MNYGPSYAPALKKNPRIAPGGVDLDTALQLQKGGGVTGMNLVGSTEGPAPEAPHLFLSYVGFIPQTKDMLVSVRRPCD